MLYAFFDWLETHTQFPGAGVFQYLTFRAVLAAVTALFIALYVGKRVILFLRRKLIGESIRDLGPETHKKKAGTPTMGGLVILASILGALLLWGDWTNAYVWLIGLATLWMGLIGFADDYIKVFLKNKAGLKGKFKVFGQVGLGLLVGLTMVLHPDFDGRNPHLDSEGFVRPNNLLREVGFQKNDRVFMVNGQFTDDFQAEYRASRAFPNAKGDIYNIERPQEDSTRIVHVPFGQSEEVRTALFGQPVAGFATRTNVPFLKNAELQYERLAPSFLGAWGGKLVYVLLAILVVTAVSNGVNLTDGLDGLAAGTSAIVGAGLGVLAYLSGNQIFADYLNIEYIPYGGELFVYAAAFVSACVGFLWFNAHPAQVFMGDTGSLALGGAIATLALMVKKELLLPVMCGVFFIESLSVILQVGYFKYTKRRTGEGKRIFRMAPLHHHYELQGWHEAKITVRFWIVSILLVLLTFSTLKLR